MKPISRRKFLRSSVEVGAGAMAAVALSSSRKSVAANDKIIVGVMGIRGRGNFLARAFAARPDVEVAYLSDVDSRLFDSRAKAVESLQGKRPKTVQDFRRILEDPDVDNPVLVKRLVEMGAQIQYVNELRVSLEDMYHDLMEGNDDST